MPLRSATSTKTKDIFVNGFEPDRRAGKGSSRTFHRKSRTGCQSCRARRVKCDETKPVCSNCDRRQQECVYDREYSTLFKEVNPGMQDEELEADHPMDVDVKHVSPSAMSVMPSSTDPRLMSPSINSAQPAHKHVDEPKESKSRRLLELELMHFYITETGPSLPFDGETSFDMFVKAIPRMALKSPALMYALYSYTALHQMQIWANGLKTTLPPPPLATARANYELYLSLAFQEHYKELEQLSRVNADSACMTANIMRLHAMVNMAERNLEPYTIPLDWLRIVRSHSRIFRVAWDLVGEDSPTMIARALRATSVIWDLDEREGLENRRNLEHILLPRPFQDRIAACVMAGGGKGMMDDDDPRVWDANVRRAYEITLSYIGGIRKAIENNEPLGPIRRRLSVFPMFLDRHFMEVLEEGRPRALVILGHYFALLSISAPYWHVGPIGPREVRAIADYLPPEWQDLMAWPLWFIEQAPAFSPASL